MYPIERKRKRDDSNNGGIEFLFMGESNFLPFI